MSDVVIKVENLGKKYRIQHQAERQRYVALRDILAEKAKSVVRSPWSLIRRWFHRNGQLRSDNGPLTTDHRPPTLSVFSFQDFKKSSCIMPSKDYSIWLDDR